MIFAVVGIVLAGTALLIREGVAAYRSEDLLVFYWGQAGVFLFVRGAEGRYESVPTWSAPLAVLRLGARRMHARLRRASIPAPAQAAARVHHRFTRLAH